MTSPSPLERLAGPGNVLAKEAADAKEFDGLVRSGVARLKDAKNAANSRESRVDLAYGAAITLRGSVEPADYKRYVLPIIFLRFLSQRTGERAERSKVCLAIGS